MHSSRRLLLWIRKVVMYPNTASERHRVFVEFHEIISSQYDLPHVDEIQQEKLEREYEMRDEVYPDEL